MKIGLIARADDRGLGTLTWEFFNHMSPTKTLVVLTGAQDFPEHPDRFYGGGTLFDHLRPDLSLGEEVIRDFLEGLDVVYTAETFYDWRIVNWARHMGVKTVIHGMPELTRHHREKLPKPDAWWWPTPWLMKKSPIPKGRLVPIPTARQEPREAAPYDSGPLLIVHPGGKRALADRDGTEIFVEALHHVTSWFHATVFSQEHDHLVEELDHGVIDFQPYQESRWSLYEGQHLMVLPRRYGGLSLKVQESLGCGVPVIMPNVEPNDFYPGPRVAALPGPHVRVPFGPLPTWNASPHAIAEQIDILAENRDLLAAEQEMALWWANEYSWGNLADAYDFEFELVCS